MVYAIILRSIKNPIEGVIFKLSWIKQTDGFLKKKISTIAPNALTATNGSNALLKQVKLRAITFLEWKKFFFLKHYLPVTVMLFSCKWSIGNFLNTLFSIFRWNENEKFIKYGQTHSNNSSANYRRLFECVWSFCGIGA